MIYDTWYMIYDTIWYMIYDIWYMIYDIWYMIYDIWYMIYDIWYMIYDIWYVYIYIYTVYNIYIYMWNMCWNVSPHRGSYKTPTKTPSELPSIFLAELQRNAHFAQLPASFSWLHWPFPWSPRGPQSLASPRAAAALAPRLVDPAPWSHRRPSGSRCLRPKGLGPDPKLRHASHAPWSPAGRKMNTGMLLHVCVFYYCTSDV